MNTTTNTGEQTMSTTVEISKAWWQAFEYEPICTVASNESSDPKEQAIARLLNAEQVGETKRVIRLALDSDQIDTLLGEAKWYIYYWGEMAGQAWNADERMPWLALVASSKALAKRVSRIVAERDNGEQTMNERLAKDFEDGMNRGAVDSAKLTYSGICREIERMERLLVADSDPHMTDRYRHYLSGMVQGFRLEIGEPA